VTRTLAPPRGDRQTGFRARTPQAKATAAIQLQDRGMGLFVSRIATASLGVSYNRVTPMSAIVAICRQFS
jgi:hypothetical protein